MSSREQPPHETYPSKTSRGGIFLHQTTTSPHAISNAPMETAASSRSSTYPPHNLNRSQDEQIQELVKTLDIYRKEVDNLRFLLEESRHQAKAEKRKTEHLERQLREEQSANIQSQKDLRQAQSRIAELTKSVGSFHEPTAQTSTSHLAIMPPPSSHTLVQRSVNPASSQHHIDHLSHNLDRFFQQAENWAKGYANTPVPAALQDVVQKFKDRHRNLAISSHLLHNPETSCYAMTKLILFSLIDTTFQPKCFERFNIKHSEQLRAEHHKVYGGIPSKERKALAEARSSVIKTFVQDPNWAGFLNNFVSNKCAGLWQLLRPVFGPAAAADEAWPSFVGLFREAVSIALTMHQRVCLFRVDFPPVGEGSAFNPADMTVIAASVDRARPSGTTGYQRLKLAITPVIRKTVFEESGAIGATVPVCKAKVTLE